MNIDDMDVGRRPSEGEAALMVLSTTAAVPARRGRRAARRSDGIVDARAIELD